MDRAQAYTLEGTIAAVVVVLAVFYGLQAVDTGPWTGGAEREPDRLGTQAADFLSVTAANGTLNEALRCYGSGKDVIDGGEIDHESLAFERQLHHTFDRQGVEYNLYVSYWDPGSGRQREILTSTDENALAVPRENAGSAVYRMALYDDDPTLYNDCTRDDGPKMERLEPYGQSANEDSELYHVLEVRLVVW